MYVDSHCHLDYPGLIDDLPGVVARARNAGVSHMVTISTKLSQFAGVRAIAERFDNIYCSVGVHPHEAGEEAPSSVEHLLELARHPKVVGIGETGLDYFYEHSPRAAQQESFRLHIRAARESGLPLIVHSRDADKDTIRILQEEQRDGPCPGLIHCFSSGPELAEKSIEMGFYISLSGIVTFKGAKDLQATVRTLPLDRLLIETDSPYLAPVPHRGKTNEPAFVAHTAAAVAALQGVTVEQVADATTTNFFRLFRRCQGGE
ncbi:TatD family hydrolase [Oceanibacterium hippocampi]|uniref:Putative deoxyribonuclease YcfH n=1 Tax=Oceanibacterium hippocampi TaxID=745714 RepID=A0A1Y5T6E0_9PROT|nr:TatD family hydrolase [Oceanibacterium hippocampi]SLN54787.1 putative deoxyribonuclease YcfH [Oceanibacterium hippocampi]